MDIFQSTVVFIFIIGSLTLFLRKKLAGVFTRLPLPRFVLFLLVGTLYSILEENINCPGNDCSNIIPFTIPIFFIFLVVDLTILKIFRIKSFRIGALVFGLIGWIAEFMLGASMGILWSSPLITVLMTFWVILTYSIITIVPVTILLDKKKGK